MQFYKKRDFGELISATFDFLKQYGRNYFKNYIIINGMIIILLLVVFYIGFGELVGQLFSSNTGGQQFYFEEYFYQNQEVLVITFILFFILFILLSLVSYSFPVLYMKRVSQTGNMEVTSEQMLADIKNIIPKFFIYFLGMILVITPIALILVVISSFLMIILIGFALLLVLLPTIMNIINFTLFHYYHTDDGYFDSLYYGLRTQFSKNFWKYWGSIAIMYMMVQVITSVFTFLPTIILMGSGFVNPEAMEDSNVNVLGMVFIAIYAVSMLASFILMNLLYVNTGFMYYDSRTDLHRDMQFSEIDSLGQSEG